MPTEKLIRQGNQLEELVGIPMWTEDENFLYFSQDESYQIKIDKEQIIEHRLRYWELIDLIVADAKKQGCEVFQSYEDLPFTNLLNSTEMELADYLLTSNSLLCHNIIQENGMNGLYFLIHSNVVNAKEAERNGEDSEIVNRIIYDGVQVENETEIPLIINYKYKPFSWEDGQIPFQKFGNGLEVIF